MNAKEVMQALLDGKTVESVYGKFKLEPNGEILHYYVNGEEWDVAEMIFNDIRAEFKIIEEYPLTFKEAMQEAINGKKIACNRRPVYMYSFNPAGKLIEITPCGSDIASISDVLINAKWRVVE